MSEGSPVIRLLVLVGCEQEDIASENPLAPIAVGAINEAVWENDPEGSDAQIVALKESFDPHDLYEWREIWVEFDLDTVADLFIRRTIQATVKPS